MPQKPSSVGVLGLGPAFWKGGRRGPNLIKKAWSAGQCDGVGPGEGQAAAVCSCSAAQSRTGRPLGRSVRLKLPGMSTRGRLALARAML